MPKELNSESYRLFFESSHELLVIASFDGEFILLNPAWERTLGYSLEELYSKPFTDFLHPEDVLATMEEMDAITSGGTPTARFENRYRTRSGDYRWLRWTCTPSEGEQQIYAAAQDITELKREAASNASLTKLLDEAVRLRAIGELAAGIAHEINTPVQYIGDNLLFLTRAFDGLLGVVDVCAAASEEPTDANTAALRERLGATRLDFLRSQVPPALEQSLEGVERVAAIVRAMKEFAHPGDGAPSATDLAHLVLNTLTVSANEWKYVAEVETDFEDGMPDVVCCADEMSQVLLNLLVNAAHAIEEVVEGGERGLIKVCVRQDGEHAVVAIADTGRGMNEETRERVFDPFFTTKPVGKGTGQGLALAHAIVTNRHSGQIDVESSLGVGTTFTLRIPLTPPADRSKSVSVVAA